MHSKYPERKNHSRYQSIKQEVCAVNDVKWPNWISSSRSEHEIMFFSNDEFWGNQQGLHHKERPWRPAWYGVGLRPVDSLQAASSSSALKYPKNYNISPYPRCMFEDDFSFPVQRGFFWLYFPGFGYVKTSRLNTPRQGRRGVWAAIPPWDPTRWELVVGSNDTNHSWKKGQLKKSIRKSPLNACSMKKIYITLV